MFDKSATTFPAKERAVFLAHCSISPLYRGAQLAMVDFADHMAQSGITALSGYLSLMSDFHGNAAKLLKTSPDNISYINNTAGALSMIANGYPFSSGDQIISYVHEYPSNHYPWVLQERRGVELVLLSDVSPMPEYDHIDLPRGWSMNELEELATDKTRIVAVSHVQFSSGYAADLVELGGFCRERNIDLVVDCAQSLGCLPVYPEEFGISAVVSSGWKWLLGPKGSGLMYTSPEFREKIGETMAGPGLMTQGLNYLDLTWAPHRDGRKFEYSTIPWDHVAALNSVIKDVFLKYPAEQIRDEVFRLQDLLLAKIEQNNLQVLRFSEKNRSGIIASCAERESKEIVEELLAAGIVTSAPIGYLRLAPHFYNDDGQIERAAHAVNRLLC